MERKSQDWHPADIMAAIKKQGTNITELSRNAGLGASTLRNALYRPWPKGEWIIANAINLSPKVIWPSRYINR